MDPLLIADVSSPPRPPAGKLRLVNRGGTLGVMDPNGVEKTLQTEAATPYTPDPLTIPFDGAPVTYVAPAAMTGTWTVTSGKTIDLTAKTLGVLDPAPSLVVVAPGLTPAAANQELSIVSTAEDLAARITRVRPATGPGAKATAVIATDGTDALVAEYQTAGAEGNELVCTVALGDQGQEAATAEYYGGALTVKLAMDSGTGSSVTITDVSGGGEDPTEITITPPNSGTPEYEGKTVQVKTQQGEDLAAYVEWLNAEGLTIYLGTDSDGDTVPLLVELSTDLTDLTGWPGGPETDNPSWPSLDSFVVTVVTAGNLDSYNAGGEFSGYVAPVPLETSANETTAVAAAIDALDDFVCGQTGTDLVTLTDNPAPIPFTGGGDNPAITSDLDDLAALLEDSDLIGGVPGTGDGSTLLVAVNKSLTGGAGTVGTPAKLGRLAVVGTGETHIATRDDLDGTNANTWVQIFAPGA